MNEWQKTHNKVKMYKELYPKGTRVMLLHMGDDDPNPVEDGTRGTHTPYYKKENNTNDKHT